MQNNSSHLYEIRDAVAALCANYGEEYWRELDAEKGYPTEFVEEMTDAGFLNVLIPEEFGGPGLGLQEACVIADEFLQLRGSELLCLSFYDMENVENVVRPYKKMPQSVVNLGIQLRDKGGCPLIRESIRLLRPFDINEIDQTQYRDFISSRFLDELGKIFAGNMFFVPVVMAQGLALFIVTSKDSHLSGDEKISIVDAVCQISVAIISRFPQITRIFESKRLSTIEAEALFLNSNGYSDVEIGQFLNLNETTIGLLMKSVAKKLKARNRSQMIANALALSEISNMQIRDVY